MKSFCLVLAVLFCSLGIAQNIESISPSEGSPTETLNISITGSSTNFKSGNEAVRLARYSQGTHTAYINANNTVVNSDNLISAEFTLTSSLGTWSLEVYDAIDGWVIMQDGFTILTPTLKSDLKSATVNQSLTVSITGSNTLFNSGLSSVELIGNGSPTTVINGTNIQVINDTNATAEFNIPSSTPIGMYDLSATYNNYTIRNSDYFVLYPESNSKLILHVFPSNSITEGASHSMFLIGQNFENNIDSIALTSSSGTIRIENFSYVSSDSISIGLTLPENKNIGEWSPVIYTQNGIIEYSGFISIVNNWSNDPRIKEISPNFGDQGETLTVTITGNRYSSFSEGVSTVKLVKPGSPTTAIVEGINSNVVNDSVLTVDFSIGSNESVGYYDLEINSENSVLTKGNAFFVNNTEISGPATISGIINDYYRSISKSYIIRLYNSETNSVVQTTSNDNNGYFVFDNLEYGTYYLLIDGLNSGPTFQEFSVYENVNEQILNIEVIDNEVQIITGSENIYSSNNKIFPNPVSNRLSIVIDEGKEVDKIEIIEITGKVLFSRAKFNSLKTCSISMKNYPSGFYLIRLSGDGFIETRKILKK